MWHLLYAKCCPKYFIYLIYLFLTICLHVGNYYYPYLGDKKTKALDLYCLVVLFLNNGSHI